MAIQAAGVGSNLDVASLVSSLMEVERAPLQKLEVKEVAANVKISAYASLKGALSTFRTSVQALTSPARFQAMKGSMLDSTVASATVGTGAAAGSHSIEVTALASSQRLAMGAVATTATVIGEGTITFEYGTFDSDANTFTTNTARQSQTVTIDAAHNTLAGVRDAINSANIGVTASIVNDGTGQRLVVGSKSSGAANGVRISVTDADGVHTDTTGLSKLAYDPTLPAGPGKNMSELVAAADSRVLIDGLAVTRSTNTVSDAIEGVTLNLLKRNEGTPTTLTITQDLNSVQAAVDSLVKGYNDLNKALTDLAKYDPTTRTAGALQSEAALRSITGQLRSMMTAPISGAGTYGNLPSIGVSFERDGSLKLDSAKLQAALQADSAAVARLFTGAGTTTDSLIGFVSSTDRTTAGQHEVSVAQLATHGTATGSQAAALTIDGTNDIIDVIIDGVSASITLDHQTYADGAALAAQIESKINGAAALIAAGSTVKVSDSGGVLTITSDKYGAASNVTVSGGNGATSAFGAAPSSVAGLDVQGTIGGAPASGTGNIMIGTQAVDGLRLSVNGGAIGARGSVDVSRGLAKLLDGVLESILGSNGSIAARTDGLNKQLADINRQREAMNLRLEKVQKRYEERFGALDRMLTSMQSTSAYLAQQIANLNSQTR